MARNSAIGMKLPTADDLLFSTQAERDEAGQEAVRNIPLEEISGFPGHPFKVKLDENMMDMAESVKQYGVLVPALVREKKGGGYEMIAGHRRKMASELAEKQEMGSTFKMGAGTNVQDRIIASHDLDCPWRPRDVGRILRTFKIKKNVEVTDNGKIII